MKIGIDGFSLARNDSGIEVYTKELVKGISNSYPVELYCYTDLTTTQASRLTLKSSGLSNRIGTFKKLKWELLDIKELISSDVTIFHSPHFILPLTTISRAKTVVTVHDLAFVRHPKFFDIKTRMYYNLFLRQSLLKADAIICISRSCLNDILQYFPFTKSKVYQVYNGFKDFSTIRPDIGILKRLKISSPFILMIGTLNPRKNLLNAIKAFNTLNTDVELVIVGEQKKKVQIGLHNPRIKFTGHIDDSALGALYRNAELLLFPSHYEGFGFPILEAMSVDLPVLTSNVSSMPEISGYPPNLLCDPNDVQSITYLLNEFLTNNLKYDFLNHARSTIKKFSWSKMISDTLSVYEHIQKSV